MVVSRYTNFCCDRSVAVVKISWVDAAKPGGRSFSFQVDLAQETVSRFDVVRLDPVFVNGTANVAGSLCTVDGVVQADVVYRCVRCLTEVAKSIHTSFSFMISKLPLSREQEENDVLYVPQDEIDLDPLVQQELILALEVQPLCKPDCAGLCPVCGKDRNIERCTCVDTPIDPRLEVLSSFFDDEKDG